MKFVIFFGVVALACFSNAFVALRGNYPIYEGMLRKTEAAVGSLRNIAKNIEEKQKTIDGSINKFEHLRTESLGRVDKALEKMKDIANSVECSGNLITLENEGKEIKRSLDQCLDKELKKPIELKDTISIGVEGLDALQGFEEDIDKCKNNVHNVPSAMEGFWCLKYIMVNSLTWQPRFLIQNQRSTTYKKHLDRFENYASKCVSAKNVDINTFVNKIDKELIKCH